MYYQSNRWNICRSLGWIQAMEACVLSGMNQIQNNMVVTSPDADTNYDYYHETYTLQDILDKLPTLIIISSDFYKICIESSCGYWDIYYYKSDATELISKKSENIIDVAYDMLCWCIENGYVEKEGK